MKKLLIFSLLSLFVSNNLFAGTSLANSISSLNKAIRNAQAGDTVLLANGTYTDEKPIFHAIGTAEKPIVVMAETSGQVFIEGNSNMRIGGEYVEVHGFVFRNGYHSNVWEFRSKSGMWANNCRITNCTIDGYNNPDDTAKERWVLLYGKNNRVDHCYFANKTNEGVLMAVVLEEKNNDESRAACGENRHRIDHNYFGARPNLKHVDNGGEIIRIGDSYTSLMSSQTIVENNYFEYCDGEVEIISVKSCDNILRGNYFFESAGALVLRHGNRNLVENNIFIGNGKNNAAGIRVINAGHTVRNNYLEGLTGGRSYSAFSVMNGLETPKANEYHQVKDVLIEKNTLVDCEIISFNLRHSSPERGKVQTVAPENVTFKNNTFFNTSKPIVFNFLDGKIGIEGITFEKNNLNADAGLKKLKGFSVNQKMKKAERPTLNFEYGVSY